jgi:hypothetical protein
MYELAGHPQAAELLRLFADHVGAAEFEPLSTTGVPLAIRQDWQQLLAAAASLGTTTVWVACHGLGVEHDRQVNRPGAWIETCLAIQRAHAVGLRAGCNVFVTTANIGQAERLLGALGRLEVDQMAWEPATYYPTPRGRRSERLRPQLVDLLPVADRICQRSRFHGDAWANPQAYTEAAWVARALAGDWPPQLAEVEPHASSQWLPLVCRPGLELHTGVAGRYRERHGNLRADGGQAVLRRALEQADGPSTQCGSGRNSGRRLASWPPSTVTKAGKGSTSARRRFAICGWTGRGEPDAPPHSPRRRRPGTARRPSDGCGRLQLDPGRAGWSR